MRKPSNQELDSVKSANLEKRGKKTYAHQSNLIFSGSNYQKNPTSNAG